RPPLGAPPRPPVAAHTPAPPPGPSAVVPRGGGRGSGGGAPVPDSQWLLPPEARGEIQRIMTAGAGVLRSEESLAAAARALDAIVAGGDGRKPAEPGTDTWEIANLHLVARVLVAAARRREETRGCHWREDRPERDDAAWQRHLIVRMRGSTLDIRTTDTTAFPPTRESP
ncbi:FAD-binding protein, partial [Streptomyces sp. 6N223]